MMKRAFPLRIILYVAALVAAIALLCSLTACNDEGVKSMTAEKTDITLEIGKSLNLRDYIVLEGKGSISYAVDNMDILDLDGSKITGLASGKASVVAICGEFTVTFNVTVIDGYNVHLSFPDTTAEYDGKQHFITPVGSYPSGTEFEFKCEGKDFLGATDAGSYIVNIKVTVPKPYQLETENFTSLLTIKKGRYDMSGVSFNNKTVVYNGREQSVAINGTLPTGISVHYVNNRATDVGKYTSTATFDGETENYEKISPMTCTLTIEPAYVFLASNGLRNEDITYSGQAFSPSIGSLPEGTVTEYYYREDGTYKKYDKIPSFADAGVYDYFVKFFISENINKNYRFANLSEVLDFTEESEDVYGSVYIPLSVRIEKANLRRGELVVAKKTDGGYGESVGHITYGDVLSLGTGTTGDYVAVIQGGGPDGIDGEFEGQYSVEYEITLGSSGKSGLETLKNKYGNLDCATYTITATYMMPTGYDRNYNTVTPVTLRLPVEKATYDISGFTFTSPEKEVEYDGNVRVFTVNGYNPDEVEIVYNIKKDGKNAAAVLHAGEYVITAIMALKSDAGNYNILPNMVLNYTVNRKKINIGFIGFDSKTTTYNGEEVEMRITGELPEKVTVEYAPGASFTNAGTYTVRAVFYYNKDIEDVEQADYTFVIEKEGHDPVVQNYLPAILTIKKAAYSEADVAHITTSAGTYFYGMKMSDIQFNDRNAAWVRPDNEVGLLTNIPGEEDKGIISAPAYYNADRTNYEDYRFSATAKITKQTIDLTGAQVNDQFVPMTEGAAKISVVFGDGRLDKYPNEIVADRTLNPDGTYKVTLAGEKAENYVLIGNTVFDGIRVYTYNPSEFTYEKGTTKMTAYKGAPGWLNVPYGTSELKSGMFDCSSGSDKKEITKIVFPDTVTKIGKNTFFGATALEEVVFNSIDALDDSVFNIFGVNSTESVKITFLSGSSIPNALFRSCDFVTEITVNTPVTTIGDEAFYTCTALRAFNADMSGLVSIGVNAFYRCYALERLVLSRLVGASGQDVTIKDYFGSGEISKLALSYVELTSADPYVLANSAFSGATSIREIKLSNALTGVGVAAFKGLLADVDLSQTTVTDLGSRAFDGFGGQFVTLPTQLASIGSQAFSGATELIRLEIPAGVSSIGEEAFKDCSAAIVFLGTEYKTVATRTFSGYAGDSLTLPSSVTTLGEGAFYGCTNLKQVNNIDAVTYIGNNCFYGCTGITTVTINAGVTTIGDFAFYGCNSIQKFTFRGTHPPKNTARSVFSTRGGIFVVEIISGADQAEFEQYLNACGAEGRYTIGKLA